MIKKVLIANRGEIALRIIRAATELQIKTVAVYSTVDRNELHVQLADEAFCIGEAPSHMSYLNIDAIIQVALMTDCDAIHPGYGFLSENANFAKKVKEAGLIFIGPSYEVIEIMGDKVSARNLMIKNGVAVVPGSDGAVSDYEKARDIAEKLGYPVLIKASGGGGGRGMRKVFEEAFLKSSMQEAIKEAGAHFSNSEIYIEKFIENPRHIEVQVACDNFGNVVAIGERNCSLQLRNQKMIEEAPCKNISENTRVKLKEYALRACRAASYTNLGTVEFIVDKDENIYFIEMNTRIQVEHPVTEMISSIDLVKEQFRIASNLHLSFCEEDLKLNGHAIEIRIIAQDPMKGFLPQTGKIDYLFIPGGFGTRVDTHMFNGVEISPYYDSLIAKLIVHDSTRIGAIRKLRRAVEEMAIEGIATNLDLIYAIIHDREFIKGDYDTSFMEKNLTNWLELMEEFKWNT